MDKKALKIAAISLGVVIVVGVVPVLAWVVDCITIPDRITNIVQKHARDSSIFTKDKIVDTEESWLWNGDGYIQATYRLTSSDVEKLSAANWTPVHCATEGKCTIETTSPTETLSCVYINSKPATTVDLCVDSQQYEAVWKYSTY